MWFADAVLLDGGHSFPAGFMGLFSNGSRDLDGLASCGNSLPDPVCPHSEGLWGPGSSVSDNGVSIKPGSRLLRSLGSRLGPLEAPYIQKICTLLCSLVHEALDWAGCSRRRQREGGRGQTDRDTEDESMGGPQISFVAPALAVCL